MTMYEFDKISLKFAPKSAISTVSALVQIMACRRRQYSIIWNNDG